MKNIIITILILNSEVLANWSDIIIKNKKDTVCLLICVAIPSDRNVVQRKPEYKSKYKKISKEIQGMWNINCFVLPVITGATEIVAKGLKNYLRTIPGRHSVDSL